VLGPLCGPSGQQTISRREVGGKHLLPNPAGQELGDVMEVSQDLACDIQAAVEMNHFKFRLRCHRINHKSDQGKI
jgi:hypothetical protein